jgi:hypothetical protein
VVVVSQQGLVAVAAAQELKVQMEEQHIQAVMVVQEFLQLLAE